MHLQKPSVVGFHMYDFIPQLTKTVCYRIYTNIKHTFLDYIVVTNRLRILKALKY